LAYFCQEAKGETRWQAPIRPSPVAKGEAGREACPSQEITVDRRGRYGKVSMEVIENAEE
jgi:hypothetical protein